MQRWSYATATACLVAPTCAHPKEQQLQEFFCPKNRVLGKNFSLEENRGIVAVSALQMCMHDCYKKDSTKNLLSFDREATFSLVFHLWTLCPNRVDWDHSCFCDHNLFFVSCLAFPTRKILDMGFLLFPTDSRALAQTMANKQSQKKNKRSRELHNHRLTLIWRWRTLHRSMIGK